MPGIRLVTNLAPRDALETAAAVARRLGYAVRSEGSDLIVRKGNPVVGLLLGALFPYTDLRVFVSQALHGKATLTVQRNEPSGLLAGQIAVSQVRRRNEELADAVAETIQQNSGEVYAREAF